MIKNWGSRNPLLGAAGFVFLTAVSSAVAGVQEHSVTPSHKIEVTYLTPLTSAQVGVFQYDYVPSHRLRFDQLTPTALTPQPSEETDPGGSSDPAMADREPRTEKRVAELRKAFTEARKRAQRGYKASSLDETEIVFDERMESLRIEDEILLALLMEDL